MSAKASPLRFDQIKMDEDIVFTPQAGKQTDFASSIADIAIFGGAAGGGKTYGILLEAARNTDNENFGAAIFRKNSTQITNEGGLWDTSMDVYPYMGAIPRTTRNDYKFPSGAKVSFKHLEYDQTVLDWQGSQIPLICFDELTHFSEYQFFYMLSRNRSTCGIKPYVRATTNPDADSWVAEFISWWWDEETGYPITEDYWDKVSDKYKGVERSGVIRWMIRVKGEIRWFGTYDEAKKEAELVSDDIEPKSVTFISSRLDDNQILVKADPGYRANLYAMSEVEQLRLLGGNWLIRATGGKKFKKAWFKIHDEYPRKFKKICRYWDLAATEPKPGKDPDWTVGTKMGIDEENIIWKIDQIRTRGTPGAIDKIIKETAEEDGRRVTVVIEEEGGSSGKFTSAHFAKLLIGYIFRPDRPSGSKEVRANPYAAYAENGNVNYVRGDWNKADLDEHEAFPNPDVHDDTVDSSSGGFKFLTEKPISTAEAMKNSKRANGRIRRSSRF